MHAAGWRPFISPAVPWTADACCAAVRSGLKGGNMVDDEGGLLGDLCDAAPKRWVGNGCLACLQAARIATWAEARARNCRRDHHEAAP